MEQFPTKKNAIEWQLNSMQNHKNKESKWCMTSNNVDTNNTYNTSSLILYNDTPIVVQLEGLQHHEHKGHPGVTPETSSAIGEKTQLILMWVTTLGVEN